MPDTTPDKPSFLREFIRDRNVAAVSPSSPFLMRRLIQRLGSLSEARLVIELGPGDGVAMREILALLAADARYLAIERNPNFAVALRDTDSRVTVLQGNAQDLASHSACAGIAAGTADAVIASIPFTYLSPDERRTVVATAKNMLRPGGTFVIFHQYMPLMAPYINEEFGGVTTEFEALNIFPCFMMSAKR